MRRTRYAEEIAEPADIGGLRIERLRVFETGQEEIRFSWWKDGRFVPRPLDLSEDELLDLMRQAILERRVFTPSFLDGLQRILAERSNHA
jgi:hypothetical protein